MKPRELHFGQFCRDLRDRSAYGSTWLDRVKLMVAQVAYTLRWRIPWLAPGGVLLVNVQWGEHHFCFYFCQRCIVSP